MEKDIFDKYPLRITAAGAETLLAYLSGLNWTEIKQPTLYTMLELQAQLEMIIEADKNGL